jgi:hypothetical protein
VSLSTYSAAVRTKIDAAVPAALSTALFKQPNKRAFTSGATKPTIGTPWVTYTLTTLDNLNISPGFRWNEGLAIFQCFVPIHAGHDDAETLAEEVAGALRDQTFTGGHFRNCRSVEVGDDGEGWYQINVEVEFYQDETRS